MCDEFENNSYCKKILIKKRGGQDSTTPSPLPTVNILGNQNSDVRLNLTL